MEKLRSIMQYRNNGAIGALLDKYERALEELIRLISPVSESTLSTIIDHETDDPDCRSIQTILTHVVRAGYIYEVEIRKGLGEKIAYKNGVELSSPSEYINALRSMFKSTSRIFEDYPNLQISHFNNDQKLRVKWENDYDLEQLMEHAIVHILRHRRQIERFLIKV